MVQAHFFKKLPFGTFNSKMVTKQKKLIAFTPFPPPPLRQSKTACGYWYNTIFVALKRTGGCLMMLEGSIAEDLSHMQNRKPAASLILISTQFHRRKMIQEYFD